MFLGLIEVCGCKAYDNDIKNIVNRRLCLECQIDPESCKDYRKLGTLSQSRIWQLFPVVVNSSQR